VTTTPNFGYFDLSSKRLPVVWKLSFAVAAVILTFYAWRFGSELVQGRLLANMAVQHFHQEFNEGQYEQITLEGDDGFADKQKRAQFMALLETVHSKLGNADSESFVNMTVNVGTDGTFLSAEYNTTFDHEHVLETYTWRKKSGKLLLYGYKIRSNSFLPK
jgi:hypothetical protein